MDKLLIAGLDIPIRYFHTQTPKLFGVLCSSEKEFAENREYGQQPVFVRNYEWDFWKSTNAQCNEIAEYSLLSTPVSDYMLNQFRCIIHAAAVSFRGRAWLFAAPPGVGKSTQVRSLQKLYPREFGVICGDRPVLELQADGTVMVHPSPWNGKENWHGAEKAPLAGILCLKRGKETSIRRWTKAEAVIPVYMSLISSRETEELIRQLSAFETELLTRVPVYEYVNGGVPDSARYLYENLLDGGRLEGET